MLTYQSIGPNEAGDYLIGYATPGAPHVFTAAGASCSAAIAAAECARLNEAQVVEKRAAMARQANLIAVDLPRREAP